MQKTTVAKGDGIGPEIMDATLSILKAANARIEWHEIAIGEQLYLTGSTSGINKKAWKKIISNKVFLKAPITTPQGGGYKSLNVTMRKTLGLYANIRPCKSFHPFVATKHPDMDVVIIQENEEDIDKEGIGKELVDTKAFALAVIDRIGQKPSLIPIADYEKDVQLLLPTYTREKASKKVLKGVDVFVDWTGTEVGDLAKSLQKPNNGIGLTMITNRGVKVWPKGFDETFCTDHWRCRYEIPSDQAADKAHIPDLLRKAIMQNIDVIKTENLYEFDGEKDFSLGQGQ